MVVWMEYDSYGNVSQNIQLPSLHYYEFQRQTHVDYTMGKPK